MRNQQANNNKRIAKNTLALYFRQILIMVVSLYTSRIVLQVLGVEDFGIYNVVGGVVTMFSFITGTMGSASQRFLAYDMAKGDKVVLKQTFSLIMLSYIGLAALTIILTESTAVWFLNTHMTIPPARIEAANWVLQFSILTFVFHILQAPYMAVIIAHEHMNVYAYISVVEVILKLLIVYLLQMFLFDKLILYAILMALSSMVIFIAYSYYCHRNFPESHYSYYYNGKRLKDLCSFAWWNIVGAIANILRSQGINVLLNMFFNPTVNAARGIAYQVNSAITSFYNNFYTAVKPQIVKSYAKGETETMLTLICRSSRFAYFLVLVMVMPFMFYADRILAIWLGTVPELTDIFVKTVLITALIETLSMPIVSGLQAANRIKEIQMTVSALYLMNIPISYVFLRLGYPPITPMYVNIVLILVALIPRIWIARNILHMSVSYFAKDVLLRIVIVSTLSLAICYVLYISLLPKSGFFVILSIGVMSILSCIVSLLLGFSYKEKQYIINIVKNKFNKNGK